MLDINFIEKNKELVIKQLNKRNANFSTQIEEVITLNTRRKVVLGEVEKLKNNKNTISKEIGILMKDKKLLEVEQAKNQVINLNKKIEQLDVDLKSIISHLDAKMRYIPNIPNEQMPIGVDEDQNIQVRIWNENKKLTSLDHWDIASKLKLVDFEAGPKLSGSRFLVYTGAGAKIIRALADILLTRHTNNGYQEMFVPVLVNEQAMYGTGQLPKFADDAYKVGSQYLIPTSEVPLTNLHAQQILDINQLPIKYTAYTQCFRQEAGSAGRDTKGMIRLHQFNKVELVKLTDANSSNEELEKLTRDAEDILQIFNLPYRVVELCTGDVGFSALKTYDLEVWFPSQGKYREISSCSNCGDFQARNMQTRYRNENGEINLVHTLNGSGVAIDRLFASILENYYDGEKLILPNALRPYFNNKEFLN